MKMNETEEKTDWGTIYKYNTDQFSFALYIYEDDKQTIYLSSVKVEDQFKGLGYGNKILELAKIKAKEKGISSIRLKVLKSSWVHNWYSSKGYADLCDDEDINYVWMWRDIAEL